MDAASIRRDFDEIARLADEHESRTDRYDPFLLSLILPSAATILEVGCGLGQLTAQLAQSGRAVLALDLSPEMLARAHRNSGTANVQFVCGDFLNHDFGSQRFDCVISAATLHHMSADVALARMIGLLQAGGQLIIHDIRADGSLLDRACSYAAAVPVAVQRLLRTGRALPSRVVRNAWLRHGRDERYLTLREAQAMANRLLPGAVVYNHWLWRYTLVWQKPR